MVTLRKVLKLGTNFSPPNQSTTMSHLSYPLHKKPRMSCLEKLGNKPTKSPMISTGDNAAHCLASSPLWGTGGHRKAKAVLMMKASIVASVWNSRELRACGGCSWASSDAILWWVCLLLKFLGVEKTTAYSSHPLHCMNVPRLMKVRLEDKWEKLKWS